MAVALPGLVQATTAFGPQLSASGLRYDDILEFQYQVREHVPVVIVTDQRAPRPPSRPTPNGSPMHGLSRALLMAIARGGLIFCRLWRHNRASACRADTRSGGTLWTSADILQTKLSRAGANRRNGPRRRGHQRRRPAKPGLAAVAIAEIPSVHSESRCRHAVTCRRQRWFSMASSAWPPRGRKPPLDRLQSLTASCLAVVGTQRRASKPRSAVNLVSMKQHARTAAMVLERDGQRVR